MLESELNLQAALNEAGAGATGECLLRFDTDGSKILIGSQKLTSKGLQPKTYQTPYGPARIARHVYQSAHGGAVFCPLDGNARIIRTATPLFAKQVSFKYANSNAATVVTDFQQHGREVARSYVGEVDFGRSRKHINSSRPDQERRALGAVLAKTSRFGFAKIKAHKRKKRRKPEESEEI